MQTTKMIFFTMFIFAATVSRSSYWRDSDQSFHRTDSISPKEFKNMLIGSNPLAQSASETKARQHAFYSDLDKPLKKHRTDPNAGTPCNTNTQPGSK